MQNVYDSNAFFLNYQQLRNAQDSANELVEKPAFFALLGSVQGLRILDMGCGCGENCALFSDSGALSVLGIDLSENMLAVAEAQNQRPNVRFERLPMEKLSSLSGPFDAVVSSLAVHYVEDFPALCRNVYALLPIGGRFLFSQEHPFTTAPQAGASWAKKDSGEIDHYKLSDYGCPGERKTFWLGETVLKYHRTFSEIVSGLNAAGFCIEQMLEPLPPEAAVAAYPKYAKCIHKPDFLLVSAKKL